MKLSDVKPNQMVRIGKFLAIKLPDHKMTPLYIIGHYCKADRLFPVDYNTEWEYKPNYALNLFFADWIAQDDPEVHIVNTMKRIA